MVNIGPFENLPEHHLWKIIDHTAIGPDLRIRLIKCSD
jgi:hypothetical protein